MRREFIVMPIAILFMILGVLVGIFRYANLYNINIYLFVEFYPIHPHIIIYGFISLLILFERYMGITNNSLRNILKLGIIVNAVSMILLIITSYIDIPIFGWMAYNLFYVPPAAYLFFLITYRRYIVGPALSLEILSMIIYFYGVYTLSINIERIVSATYLLLFPTLFILGERLELIKFVPVKRIYGMSIIYISGLLALLLNPFLIGLVTDIRMLVGDVILITALVLLVSSQDIGLKKSVGEDEAYTYLRRHLAVSYIFLYLGLLAGVAYLSLSPPMNLYDLYIHFIALGFIGSMLIGHGPIIISRLLGMKPLFRYTPLYLLILSISTRAVTDLLYLWMPQILNTLLILISSVSILVVIPAILYNIVIHNVVGGKRI